MIKEERNALLLLLAFSLLAGVLYFAILGPALHEATAPKAPDADAASTAAESPADPVLDTRPKAARRMVTVRAIVCDAATGEPLSAATCKVLNVGDIAEPVATPLPGGTLLVEYLPPDAQFGLELSCAGYRSETILRLRGTAKQVIELGVVALAPERAVEGVVRDAAGSPIAGAQVSLFALPLDPRGDSDFARAAALAEALTQRSAGTAKTDVDGRFRVESLEARPFALHCAHEKLAPALLPAVDLRYRDQRCAITLRAGPAARARLEVEGGGAVAGGLLALVEAAAGGAPQISATLAITAADGTLALGALAAAPHFVFVCGGPAACCGCGPYLLPSAQEIKVHVPPSSPANGTVLDGDRLPLENAEVYALSRGDGSLPVRTRTDAKGRWSLAGLGVGPARLRIRAPGYACDDLTLDVGAAGVEHKTTLLPGGALSGRVSTGGKGVLGGRVRVIGQDLATVSGPDGGFQLAGLPAGPVEIECGALGCSSLARRVEIDRARDNKVDLELSPGGETLVKLLGPDDKPLPRARLLVAPLDAQKRPDLARMRRAETDDAGLARCVDLRNGDAVMLFAAAAGLAPVRSQEFVLKPEHAGRGVALTLSRGASLRGKVLDENGQGIAFARVRAAADSDSPADALLFEHGGTVCWSRADGTFELIDLPPRPFRLVAEMATRRRVRSDPIELSPAEQRVGVTFTLNPARPVFGIVKDAQGGVLAGASVRLVEGDAAGSNAQVQDFTDWDGRFYFMAPCERPFALVADAGARGTATLTVEGDDAQPPFELQVSAPP